MRALAAGVLLVISLASAMSALPEAGTMLKLEADEYTINVTLVGRDEVNEAGDLIREGASLIKYKQPALKHSDKLVARVGKTIIYNCTLERVFVKQLTLVDDKGELIFQADINRDAKPDPAAAIAQEVKLACKAPAKLRPAPDRSA